MLLFAALGAHCGQQAGEVLVTCKQEFDTLDIVLAVGYFTHAILVVGGGRLVGFVFADLDGCY